MPANKISVYIFLPYKICLFLTLICSYRLTNIFQFAILPSENVIHKYKLKKEVIMSLSENVFMPLNKEEVKMLFCGIAIIIIYFTIVILTPILIITNTITIF